MQRKTAATARNKNFWACNSERGVCVLAADSRPSSQYRKGSSLRYGSQVPPGKLRARSQYHGHVSSLELGRLFHNTFFFSVRYDTLEDFQS